MIPNSYFHSTISNATNSNPNIHTNFHPTSNPIVNCNYHHIKFPSSTPIPADINPSSYITNNCSQYYNDIKDQKYIQNYTKQQFENRDRSYSKSVSEDNNILPSFTTLAHNSQPQYSHSANTPHPQQNYQFNPFTPSNSYPSVISPISPIVSPRSCQYLNQQNYFPTSNQKGLKQTKKNRKSMNQELSNPSPIQVTKKKVKKSKKPTSSTDHLIGKFSSKINPTTNNQSNPKPRKSKNANAKLALLTNNKINYPIHKINHDTICDMPQDKLASLQSIYPTIAIKKYSTSAIDQNRTYLTAYEYKLNDSWIVWDYETGFVHLTGIWKASLNAQYSAQSQATANNLKADIVKLSDSTPREFQQYIKRIRGGFLKIQGTWLPYKLCKILARRFCYHIRFDLIPIFGFEFPQSCLKPDEKGFGELKLDDLGNYNQDELPTPKPIINEEETNDAQPMSSLSVTQPQNKSQRKMKKETIIIPPIGTFIQPQPNLAISLTPNDSTSSTSSFKKIEPITPPAHYSRPHRHSGSSSTVSSVFSNDFQKTPLATDELEYSKNDFAEIVHASKCLQSLSKPKEFKSFDENEAELTDDESNYTTSTNRAEDSGITSILYAADLKEQENVKKHISSQRPSMKINDLLT